MGYNFKIIKYANNRVQCRYYSNIIHENDSITEKINDKRLQTLLNNKSKKHDHDIKEWSEYVSKTRTINNIYSITRSNIWEYFITITFNPKLVDRTDYDSCMKYACDYLHLMRKKYCKDIQYCLIPELHKDKKSWHIHGLIANIDRLPLIDSGIRTKKELVVYNLPEYRYGFTSATKITDNFAVCSYVTKYITKELVTNTMNRHRYLCSKNLNKPEVKKKNITKHELDNLINENLDKILFSKQLGDDDNSVTYIEFKDFDFGDDFQDMSYDFENL